MKQQKESRAPDLPHPFFFLCWTPNYFISLHYLDFVIVQEPNPLTQTQIPTISSFEVLDGKFLLFSKMGSWFSVCLVGEMARVEWVSQKQGEKNGELDWQYEKSLLRECVCVYIYIFNDLRFGGRGGLSWSKTTCVTYPFGMHYMFEWNFLSFLPTLIILLRP